jgi:hypothetical protein
VIRVVRRVILVALVLLLASCGKPGFPNHRIDVGPYLSPAAHANLPTTSASYFGVYEPGVPHTFHDVDAFTAKVGRAPNLLLYYSNWGQPFQTTFALRAFTRGAVPVVQISPGTTSLGAIAAGRYDTYLRSFATEVRAFARPVVIGFAREMNGTWYPWSAPHVSPATWIAAWRHIVTIFRRQGADNVTWQWTINDVVPGIAAPRKWWPGASYVTWIGIDGYYYTPADTFSRVFGTTIKIVRTFTSKPIVISETATNPQADPTKQISELFADITSRHLLGLVWFDAPAHRDWRLENDPTALITFRRNVVTMFANGKEYRP